MKKISAFYRSHTEFYNICIGLLLSLLLMMPYLILGTGSIITYHDQLDGELLNYILSAKYFFTDVKTYPEILNGLPSTGAIPPAPLFVLFYMLLEPFAAFLLSQWIILIVGFLGMYLLIRRLTAAPFVSLISAAIFMQLPFYPVYGLCITGQPLLVYCILCLYQPEHPASRRKFRRGILPVAFIFLYSLCSSLVLVGFACLLALGVAALYLTVRSLINKTAPPWRLWLALAVLTAGYLISNLSLIRQILFPAPGQISHKAEVIYTPQDFLSSFAQVFYPGVSYAEAWQLVLLPLAVLCLLLAAAAKLRHDTADTLHLRSCLKKAAAVLCFILLLCTLCALYSTPFAVRLRNLAPGALSGFNMSRIAWLLPTAWLVLTGYLLFAVYPGAKAAPKLSRWLRCLAVFLVFALYSLMILIHSPLRLNISKLLKGGDYYALDWERFYATDIFEQIDGAIGRPKEDYRVVSLGIYPAAAAYNGFYCLDGYSNNYPLSYKHTFREIMADELAKNDYIRQYFDCWGNRCYLTTAEHSNYYTIEKKWNSGFHDLALNTEKLKELGCDYIFSATWILNADELGLELLREAPFETENSWYNIYVYEVK